MSLDKILKLWVILGLVLFLGACEAPMHQKKVSGLVLEPADWKSVV